MKTLIKNGTIITGEGQATADIVIAGEKIDAIIPAGNKIKISGSIFDGIFDETIDATDLLVLPGAVDAHVHFSLPYEIPAHPAIPARPMPPNHPAHPAIPARPDAKTTVTGTSADDFFTGTRAAACGGVTTVIDFVTPTPGETLMEALEKRRSEADGNVCIDYGLHMSVVNAGKQTLAQIPAIVNAGIPSFKTYMTYSFRLTDEELEQVLTATAKRGAITMIHAESHSDIETLKAEFIRQGKTDPWHHYLSRPEQAETDAVNRAAKLALDTGATLYIVHLSSIGGVEAVKAAKQAITEARLIDRKMHKSTRQSNHGKCRIYAETCPQYLHFTNDVFKRPDACKFICSPPMKGDGSRAALRSAITDGTVSTVATDHCPFTLAEKTRSPDFTKIPNGVMGTEILYPYMLSLANEGLITYKRALELCCENPARIFGLPQKGTLKPGTDADIVLYDPLAETTIKQENMHSGTDYTIWEGLRLKGRITTVYSRGKQVFKNGTFTGTPGAGRYLPRTIR